MGTLRLFSLATLVLCGMFVVGLGGCSQKAANPEAKNVDIDPNVSVDDVAMPEDKK